MALQLCQSSGGAVSLLLGIAVRFFFNFITAPRQNFFYLRKIVKNFNFQLSDQLTLVAIMKIIFFVVALFFLLGLFLCNAGEITYQVIIFDCI